MDSVENSPETEPPAGSGAVLGNPSHVGPPAAGPPDTGTPDAIEGRDDVGDGTDDAKDPLRFSNWMKRSATGAVMTGIAMGLQQALEPQNREVPFVIEAKGEPEDPDRPIDLRFDPDSPADTVAIIRRPPTGDHPPT